jgi:hypothetical protein
MTDRLLRKCTCFMREFADANGVSTADHCPQSGMGLGVALLQGFGSTFPVNDPLSSSHKLLASGYLRMSDIENGSDRCCCLNCRFAWRNAAKNSVVELIG